MRYPDLICLGAQKAATTWLDKALRSRPDVFLPPVKELHYFSQLYNDDAGPYGPIHRQEQASEFISYIDSLDAPTDEQRARQDQARHLARAEVDDDWYGQIFAPARDDQICAEICPSYMNMPEAGVEHALRLNANARFLILVRDPIDRAWSHIRMHMSRGSEPRDTSGLVDGTSSLWPYLFYTDYAASVPLWMDRTPAGQLRLILHDRVESDPHATLCEIQEFADLPVEVEEEGLTTRVHRGEVIDMTPELRAKLLEVLRPQYDFLQGFFPDTVESWLARHEKALSA